MNFLLVFIGGGLGSLLRYVIGLGFGKLNIQLPFATLVANIVSCAVFAGILQIYQQKQLIPDAYRAFVIIGICGGLSTFSTFSFETFELMKQGFYAWALANVLVSLVLCLLLFFVFAR